MAFEPAAPEPSGPPIQPNQLSRSVAPNQLGGAPVAPQHPTTTAGPADAPWTPPPMAPRPRSRRAALVGGFAILAGLIGTIGWKLLVGTVAAGLVGGTLSSLFGGPWDKLPSNVRSDYQHRLEAAVGDRLDGKSESEKRALFDGWLHGGFARLDDGRLVRHLQLEIKALDQVAEADCARFGRNALAGKPIDDQVSQHLVASLDEASMVEFIGLNIDAVEAELRGSPAAVQVSADESATILNGMVGGLTAPQLQTLAAAGGGSPIADHEMCDAIRGLYGQVETLDSNSMAIIARADISQ
jgi:hypothetical protein